TGRARRRPSTSPRPAALSPLPLHDALPILARGDVHADRELGARVELVPLTHLPAGLPEYPPSDRDDCTRFFCERDEVGGLHEAARRVLPADERLEAGEPSVAEVHDRLVVHDE